MLILCRKKSYIHIFLSICVPLLISRPRVTFHKVEFLSEEGKDFVICQVTDTTTDGTNSIFHCSLEPSN